MSKGRDDDRLNHEVVTWGLGCLVAAAALVGSLILVFVIAILVEPPHWVQILVGLGLVSGGVLLGWLVAKALGEGRVPRGPRRIEPPTGSDPKDSRAQ